MSDLNSLSKIIILNNGHTMPVIHLGTYETHDKVMYRTVLDSLEVGYRAFEAAQMYGNEHEVGAAASHWIAQAETRTRSDIFFTTKLAENAGYDAMLQSIRHSAEIYGLGYINLFLSEARRESWRAVENAMAEGIVKAGGVGNFGIKHLEELLSSNIRTEPSVDQIEVHPLNARTTLVNFSQSNNIQVQAYCPLVHGLRMQRAGIVALAQKYERTVSQILIRWSVQKGTWGFGGWRIEGKDMQVLHEMDEDLVTDWDPTDVP